MTVLESLESPDRTLVVGNTHLWFRPEFPHVRLLQVSMDTEADIFSADFLCMTFLSFKTQCSSLVKSKKANFSGIYRPIEIHENSVHFGCFQIAISMRHLEHVVNLVKTPSAKPAVLLCGDFNSTTGWGVHKFLNTGSIPSDFREWKQCMCLLRVF